MRTRTWTAAVAVLALALAGCGDDDDEATDIGAGDDTETEYNDGDVGGGGGGNGAADVTMSNFAFDPDELSVAAGDTIAVQNDDGTTHSFTSDDGGFDVELGGGEGGEATAPSEPGEYEFHCRFHSSMQGTLTVE